MRRIALAFAALLILAVPAFAAPAREATLVANQPYTWEGGPGNGVIPSAAGGGPARCTPIYQCEDTLVEIKEPGDLAVQIKAGAGSTDLDVAIFESDSAGTVNADSPANQVEPGQEPKAEDISTGADAKATARKLKAGFYVIRVRFYAATQGIYTGAATLSVPPPVVEAPPATTPPPVTTPASKPTANKKKAAACKKKAKRIKNGKKRKKALKKCRRKARRG